MTAIDSGLATFMIGVFRCDEEITLMISEDDVQSFPENSLLISPETWRSIKLCGRAIEFDETGIVSAMSRVESDIPTLNISTASTNCTLVPEYLLENALTSLSEVLNCPVAR